MSSRYYFTLILCAGMGAFPAQSNAQEAGIIDLTKRLKPFNAGRVQFSVMSSGLGLFGVYSNLQRSIFANKRPINLRPTKTFCFCGP